MSDADAAGWIANNTMGDWAVFRAQTNARTDIDAAKKQQLISIADAAEEKLRSFVPDLSFLGNMTEFERNTWVQKYQKSEADKMAEAQRIASGAGAPTSPTNPGTPEQRDAMATMRGQLDYYGLGSLAEPLWAFILENGKLSESESWQWIQARPEFHERFPAFKALQDKKRAITPAQYVQLESQYVSTMRQAGIPLEFFDKPDDFTKLISNEVSPSEFQQRIEKGYLRVQTTNPEVRKAFSRYFGVSGDAALAAMFIDADKAAPALSRMADIAEIGGVMMQQQVNINLDYATRLAESGVSMQQASDAARRLTSGRAMFESGVGQSDIAALYKSEMGASGETAPNVSMTNDIIALEALTGASGAASAAVERGIAQNKASVEGEKIGITTTKTGRTSFAKNV